jgi:hypothetical protein
MTELPFTSPKDKFELFDNGAGRFSMQYDINNNQGQFNTDLTPGGVCYLTHIELAPALRGRSHGDRLYRLLIRLARASNCFEIRQYPNGFTYRGEKRSGYLRRRGWATDEVTNEAFLPCDFGEIITNGSRSARVDVNRCADVDDGARYAVFKTTNYLGRDYYDGYEPFHNLTAAIAARDRWLGQTPPK